MSAHARTKVLDHRERAAYVTSRRRTKMLRDPIFGLAQTHLYANPTAAIAMADQHPTASRLLPITLNTEVLVGSGIQREGLVFEFGGATVGMACWLEDNKVGACAGNGTDATNDGVSIEYDYGALLPEDYRMNITVSCNPANGTLSLWINGDKKATGQSVDTVFSTLSWAGGDDGSFASTNSGAVTARVPVGSQIAPAGFTVVKQLSVAAHQLPLWH